MVCRGIKGVRILRPDLFGVIKFCFQCRCNCLRRRPWDHKLRRSQRRKSYEPAQRQMAVYLSGVKITGPDQAIDFRDDRTPIESVLCEYAIDSATLLARIGCPDFHSFLEPYRITVIVFLITASSSSYAASEGAYFSSKSSTSLAFSEISVLSNYLISNK